MELEVDDAPCRRRQRSSHQREAIAHQLTHVAQTLALDAIVLADDLGRPLAHAGNAELSALLAEMALWADPGDAAALDEGTMLRVRAAYPELEKHHIVADSVEVPGAAGTRVIAAGRSFARRIGVEHAIGGIERICGTKTRPVFETASTTAPSYCGVPRQRRRERGVRWLLFKH